MPLRGPAPQDAVALVGVRLPVAEDTALRVTAERFAAEFLRLGHGEEEVLSLFQNPCICEGGRENV